jgi:hypothetical protein
MGGGDHLGDLCVDWRKILKLMLKKQEIKLYTGFE